MFIILFSRMFWSPPKVPPHSRFKNHIFPDFGGILVDLERQIRSETPGNGVIEPQNHSESTKNSSCPKITKKWMKKTIFETTGNAIRQLGPDVS